MDEQRSNLPTSNELAAERTSLALRRNVLAAERTLMAWLRTALSMISFGFTMVKLFEYLETSRGPTVGIWGRTWSPAAVGLLMMTIGIVSLFLAILSHRKALKDLHQEGLKSGLSLAMAVSSLVVALGVFALASLLAGK